MDNQPNRQSNNDQSGSPVGNGSTIGDQSTDNLNRHQTNQSPLANQPGPSNQSSSPQFANQPTDRFSPQQPSDSRPSAVPNPRPDYQPTMTSTPANHQQPQPAPTVQPANNQFQPQNPVVSGQSQPQQQQFPSQNLNPGSPKKPGKGLRWPIIILAVIGLIVLLSGVWLIFSGNDKSDKLDVTNTSQETPSQDKKASQDSSSTNPAQSDDDQDIDEADDLSQLELDLQNDLTSDQFAQPSFNVDDVDRAVEVAKENYRSIVDFFYEPSTPKTCYYYVTYTDSERDYTYEEDWLKYVQGEPITARQPVHSHVISRNCGDWNRVADKRQRNELALSSANLDNVNQAVRLTTYWLKYKSSYSDAALNQEFYYAPSTTDSCYFHLSDKPTQRSRLDQNMATWEKYTKAATVRFDKSYLIAKNCGDWKKVDGVAKKDSKPVPGSFNADTIETGIEIVDDYKGNFNKEYYYKPSTPQTCKFEIDRSGQGTKREFANVDRWNEYDGNPVMFNNTSRSAILSDGCGDWKKVDG